jgi:hypothetical protein
MTVASLQLLFNDGRKSQSYRPSPDAVRAALSVMVSEDRTDWSHKLALRMADGSLVIAKPRRRS